VVRNQEAGDATHPTSRWFKSREVNTQRSFRIRQWVHSCFAPLFLAALILLGAAVPTVHSQGPSVTNYTGITVESSQQLFATMCALDAAGFDADESTLAEMPSRLRLRADLLKIEGPASDALRKFYREHRLVNSEETLSRYVTFALVVGPPPQFQFLYDRDLLPPDVLTIEDFQDILGNFFREAHLAARWGQVAPEYEHAQSLYGAPVRRIVMVTNAYLREVLSVSHGRTFTVYVEPLVGNHTNFRNYGDTYSIVVGIPDPLPLADIQHAYLHFMLDRFPLQYQNKIEAMSPLLEIAGRAPRLPVDYRDDIVGFADECFIKAVELRLRRLAPDQQEAALKNDDESGYILVRPFVEGLLKYEKDIPALQYYFPDLIAGIDIKAEQARSQNIKFAAAEATPALKHGSSSSASNGSNEASLLTQGDRAIALKQVGEAKAAFGQVLEKDPSQPRALYGMAIASVLGRDADNAKKYFEKLIAASTPVEGSQPGHPVDPALVSWAHIYLGRIFDVEDDRESAIREYQAALAVIGAPESARVAAQRGVESAYQPAAQGAGPPQQP
jgi:tetratricopeptide (TPR) repeat protein